MKLWCGKTRDISLQDVIAMMSGSQPVNGENTEGTGDE